MSETRVVPQSSVQSENTANAVSPNPYTGDIAQEVPPADTNETIGKQLWRKARALLRANPSPPTLAPSLRGTERKDEQHGDITQTIHESYDFGKSEQSESIMALYLHVTPQYQPSVGATTKGQSGGIVVLRAAFNPSTRSSGRFIEASLTLEFTPTPGVQVVDFAPTDYPSVQGATGNMGDNTSLNALWIDQWSGVTTSTGSGSLTNDVLTYKFSENGGTQAGLDTHHAVYVKLNKRGNIKARIFLKATLVEEVSVSFFGAQLMSRNGRGKGRVISSQMMIGKPGPRKERRSASRFLRAACTSRFLRSSGRRGICSNELTFCDWIEVLIALCGSERPTCCWVTAAT